MLTVEAKELVVASFGDCDFIFGGLELISHENPTRDIWSSSCIWNLRDIITHVFQCSSGVTIFSSSFL